MSRKTSIGWVQKNLSSLGKLSTSSVDKKIENGEREVCLLNYMDIYRNNFIKRRYPFMKVTASDREIETFSVRKGDVFFTPSSETPDDIGHSGVVLEEMDEVLQSYHLMRLRPSQEDPLDLNFKGYVFRSNSVYEQFRVRATGSTRFTLSIADISEVAICFPESKKEQQKIAEILTNVDHVISVLKDKIGKYELLRLGLIDEITNHTNGVWIALENILEQLIDCEHQTAPTTLESGFYVVGTQDVKNGRLNTQALRSTDQQSFRLWTARGTLSQDDVIFTREAPAGEVCTVPENMSLCLGQRTVLLKPNKKFIIGSYLALYLQSKTARQEIHRNSLGTTVTRINISEIRLLPIYLIPLDIQLDIIRKMRQLEETIERISQYIDAVGNLKTSLMQDLLTGKVRVTVN